MHGSQLPCFFFFLQIFLAVYFVFFLYFLFFKFFFFNIFLAHHFFLNVFRSLSYFILFLFFVCFYFFVYIVVHFPPAPPKSSSFSRPSRSDLSRSSLKKKENDPLGTRYQSINVIFSRAGTTRQIYGLCLCRFYHVKMINTR